MGEHRLLPRLEAMENCVGPKNKAMVERCANCMVLLLASFSTFHTHTHTHTQHNLVSLLVSSINNLEHAEKYEMMAEVFKLLQPFYEKHREFKVGEFPS